MATQEKKLFLNPLQPILASRWASIEKTTKNQFFNQFPERRTLKILEIFRVGSIIFLCDFENGTINVLFPIF